MALQEVLFISEEKLKSFTSINNNVSPLDLIPFVLQSQDLYLQNYIGATFYFQLKEQVRTSTVSAANQFILDNYIGGALCNWALQIALPFLRYRIFNKGVLAPTSENSDSVSLEEIKFLQEQCRDTAQFYMKRCVEWMVLHPGAYPKYITPNVLDGILPERGTPYYDNLVTPKRPYAWKKKIAYNNRDLANVGWYDNGMTCAECGPNFYQSPYS
jgi:hypothetical protein